MSEAVGTNLDSLESHKPRIGDQIEVVRNIEYRSVMEVGVVVRADVGDNPKTIVKLEDGSYITSEELSGFTPLLQGSYFGKHAEVSFGYNDPNVFEGIVVRHDEKDPHVMLIELQVNGRIVFDDECHYYILV